jgi:hypothetical protein
MTTVEAPVEVSVQALFDGDFLSFLVVLESTDTIPEACDKVAFGVVGRRVPPRAGVGYVMLREDGTEIPENLTVAEAGLTDSDYIRVGFRD